MFLSVGVVYSALSNAIPPYSNAPVRHHVEGVLHSSPQWPAQSVPKCPTRESSSSCTAKTVRLPDRAAITPRILPWVGSARSLYVHAACYDSRVVHRQRYITRTNSMFCACNARPPRCTFTHLFASPGPWTWTTRSRNDCDEEYLSRLTSCRKLLRIKIVSVEPLLRCLYCTAV